MILKKELPIDYEEGYKDGVAAALRANATSDYTQGYFAGRKSAVDDLLRVACGEYEFDAKEERLFKEFVQSILLFQKRYF